MEYDSRSVPNWVTTLACLMIMGFQGYMTRILFVMVVAVAFNYRNEIMETVNKAFGNRPAPSHAQESSGAGQQQKASTPPREPLKPPLPDHYNPPFDPSNPTDPIITKSGTRMITKNELAAHGHSGALKPIWLGIMGMVFDVDKGAEHYYGPEGGYKFFAGKEFSRGWVGFLVKGHHMYAHNM